MFSFLVQHCETIDKSSKMKFSCSIQHAILLLTVLNHASDKAAAQPQAVDSRFKIIGSLDLEATRGLNHDIRYGNIGGGWIDDAYLYLRASQFSNNNVWRIPLIRNETNGVIIGIENPPVVDDDPGGLYEVVFSKPTINGKSLYASSSIFLSLSRNVQLWIW